MGIASIVLNILSVVSLPMVLAFAVMTTDSPSTPKSYFRLLYGVLLMHLLVVVASIVGAWVLRSASRPGPALLTSLAPAAWIVLAFAGILLFVDFGGRKGGGA
ncbi:MAG TPA: hypothetical protein VE981_20525 [Planctomycetota bacterium]|nr:hypothetical protein [Planctomycetota bacterium]